jgi:hypothetical protein
LLGFFALPPFFALRPLVAFDAAGTAGGGGRALPETMAASSAELVCGGAAFALAGAEAGAGEAALSLAVAAAGAGASPVFSGWIGRSVVALVSSGDALLTELSAESGDSAGFCVPAHPERAKSKAANVSDR